MSTRLLSQPAYDSYSFPLTILVDSAQTFAVPLYLPPDFRIAHIIQGHMEEEDGVLFPLPSDYSFHVDGIFVCIPD